jgi:integrase
MQRGSIVKHRSSWCLRYYETVLKDGQPVRKKSFRRLAPVSPEYPSKRSVLLLAEKILAPVNTGLQQPESSMSVVAFIENVYLPYVEKERAPATYKNYKKDLFEKHLKKLLGDVRLRDFRTIHGQRILREIQPPKKSSGRTTRVRAKAFLSSVFKLAKREGFLDGENPMRDTSVPGRPEKPLGRVYTMSEIERISEAVGKVDNTAFTAIAVAAFTGLRQSEIRGLKWSDYDGTSLKISRSVWRTHIGPPKTEGSGAVVPVLPFLQGFLNEHRARAKYKSDDDYILSGERRGAPLNLANLARRVIIPALAESEDDNQKPPDWRGWHAFRRSLASNLYSCGVSPKVIQAIMRHSDMGTTLQYYVQTPDEESRAALQKIEDWIKIT